MKRRIAVLVLAHRPAALQFLLDLLDDRFALFVHLDAKTDLGSVRLRIPRHATMIEPRIEVFWGGWSMMRATLALIDAARAGGGFARYALISGDSLPVLPLDRLEAALRDGTREYVELIPVADDPSLAGADMQVAIDRHGWVQPWRLHNPVAWDHRLLNPFQRTEAARHYGLAQDRIDWIRGDVERLVGGLLTDLRPAPPFPSFWYGSQWWALSGDTIEALLPELRRPEVQRFFRTVQVPDEHMIQTVLGNRRELLGGRPAIGSPMWSDLARRAQGVETLDGAAFRGAALNGDQILFARKFDPDAAPEVAAALRAGRYESAVLGAPGQPSRRRRSPAAGRTAGAQRK
jgi:hypothetical protein